MSHAHLILTVITLLASLASAGRALAWEPFRAESDEIRKGNAHFEKGQTEEALSAYEEAAKRLPNEPGVHLNRGIALMKADKLPEAREALRIASRGNGDAETRAQANYNLGLAFLREAEAAQKDGQAEQAQKLLQESADAFKSSLRASPKNRDAAWNMELAKRRLVELEKEEQEKKDQEQKDENEKKEEDQEEDQKDDSEQDQKGDEPDDEKKPDDQKPDDGDKDEEDPQSDGGAPRDEEPKPGPDAGAAPEPPEPEPQDADEQAPQEAQPALPEHMQKALDALEDSEENLQKHRAKTRARQQPRRIEKDW